MRTIPLVAAACLATVAPAWAQITGSVDIFVAPASISDVALVPGSTFTVAVSCDVDIRPWGLFGAEVALDYDPAVLELTGHVLGDFWTSATDFGHSRAGHFEMDCVDSSVNYRAHGIYTLVLITFKVLSAGTTSLALTAPDWLVNSDGILKPAFFEATTEMVVADSVSDGSFSNLSGQAPSPSPQPDPPPGEGGGGAKGSCSAAGAGAPVIALATALALLRAGGR